jgi:ADP-heptose:LPS heptosyltransferase
VRRHFPQAHLAFLGNASANSHYALARSVLPQKGLLDEWLTYTNDIGGLSLTKELWRLWRVIRAGGFDTLVYLAPRLREPQSVRRDLWFFRTAGIRYFIGEQGFAPLPEKVAGQPLPLLEHESDHLLQRLAHSGVPTQMPPAEAFDLSLTPEETAAARHWLAENCPADAAQNRLVGFGPGSKWASKVWPEERFAQVGRRLIEEFDLFPVVLGGAEDQELGGRLLAAWGRGANAAGRLNIRQAAALLQNCRLYVGNDTGTMHLAAAAQIPCVAPFSAQDWPGRWYPFGEQHTVLRKYVPCEGCLLAVCDRQLECLTGISADEVFQACRAILSKS